MANIVVTGRDSNVTTRHKQHTEEKLAKLERYYNGVTKIEAILSHAAEGCEAELVISIRRGNPIICHSQAKELYAAVDACLDKAESQLTKHKERQKNHRGERAADAGAAPTESEGDDEKLESYEDIVEKTDFSQ